LIRAVGLDIVDVARIRRDIERFGERFARRILGDKEFALWKARVDAELFLAGRLAAKEAVIKGLYPFLSKRPPLSEIQIVNEPDGRPVLLLPDEIQRKLGRIRCHLSLTHEKNVAAAVAIFEEEP
jgi:holo-[acyl-carrier protein] synthase